MKINIEWTETHRYCEEVEVPDNLDMDEVDDWVNDNFREWVWANASAYATDESDVEWSKA